MSEIDFMTADENIYGVDPATLGSAFRARAITESERYLQLDRSQQYYDCTQHDHKRFDFDGQILPQNRSYLGQPQLSTEKASWYIPLGQRRPSNPYRLAKVIVNAFTSMIMGESKWPSILVPSDANTQDFLTVLSEAADLKNVFQLARSYGGSEGSVGLSWCFVDGLPIVNVHHAKHVYVHRWKNFSKNVVDYAIEIYKFKKQEYDPQKKEMVEVWYWYRKDWTPVADVVFYECKFTGSDPIWQIDESKSVVHNDGVCHFVWIKNIPTEDPDGISDYQGIEENCDVLDVLNSIGSRGIIANQDPTVILKMDPNQVNMMGIKKGSNNALCVGETGDAHYMELSGASSKAGMDFFTQQRRNALEVAECVLPDSSEVAAAGSSAVALRIVYAPMLSKCDTLRASYGKALIFLLLQMLEVARKRMGEMIEILVGDEVVEARPYLSLPPKVELLVDPETGSSSTKISERVPGNGTDIKLKWGDYFIPTPADNQAVSMTLTTFTGGKACLSTQTATEIAAQQYGRNPEEELARIRLEKAKFMKEQKELLGNTDFIGGKVDPNQPLPPKPTMKSFASDDEGEDTKAEDEA